MAQLGNGVTEKLREYIDNHPRMETTQERFDANYITTQELMDALDVSRPTVLLRMRHRFPTIKVGNTFFWERTPESEHFVKAWALLRQRGG